MTPNGDQGLDGGLVRRAEVLLSSLAGVVSARVILDQEKGAQVHIIATTELPVSEISRAVMSALTWGLGCSVPSDHITVVQSRLSREKLYALLGLEKADPPLTPVVPEPPPTDPPDPEPPVPDTELSEFSGGEAQAEKMRGSEEELTSLLGLETADPLPTPVVPEPPPAPAVPGPPPAPVVAGPPPTGPPAPRPPISDTGLIEFSVGGAQAERRVGLEEELPRLRLQDLQVNRSPEGGFGILVRLTDNDRSIGAERESGGTAEDSLEVPACATLGVIQEFLRTDRKDGPSVVFKFVAARRLHHPEHDVVIVVVEAAANGRRIPLTGAASAEEGVEKASILATLQATNAFVANNATTATGNGTLAQ